MALTSGQININIGAPNSPQGSDSLYTAFGKIQDNFTNVFAEATAFTTANISTSTGLSNSVVAGNITLTNTGVTAVTIGTNLTASAPNGNIILSLANTVTGLTAITTANITATANVTAANVVATAVTCVTATATGNVTANVVTALSSTNVGTMLSLTPRNTAPTNPTQGTVYYDSFFNVLRVYNGTAWGNVAIV